MRIKKKHIKSIEIKVWHTDEENLVGVYVNEKLWFDKFTNDLDTVICFVQKYSSNIRVTFMNWK